MKVLNVNRFHYLRGGADRYYFDLAKELRVKGHEVIPFSAVNKRNEHAVSKNYFVMGYDEDNFSQLSLPRKLKVFFNGIYSWETKRKISELSKHYKPDIAHLHGLFYQLSLLVIDSLYEANIPIVYALHDYHTICASAYLFYKGRECRDCCPDRDYHVLKRRCYRNDFLPSVMAYFTKKLHQKRKTLEKITFFTVPHESMRDIFVSWGFDPKKFKIILNPFLEDIKPYPYKGNKDYFVFYGRIARNKGIFTILEAFKKIPTEKLKIYGSGPDLDTVNDFIRSNKLNNVEVDAKLRWGQKLQRIIGESIAVISASQWPTPSEYANYESMALGKPILASNAVGNLGMIEDGKNGYVFQMGDSDDLLSKIKLILNNDLIAMGNRSRQFFDEKIAGERFYKELIAIYEEAINLKSTI